MCIIRGLIRDISSSNPTFPIDTHLNQLQIITNQFDSTIAEIRTKRPSFLVTKEIDNAEVADEMSEASTSATPTIPIELFKGRRISLSSDFNFALEFFKKELDKFDVFLSQHQIIINDRIEGASAPEQLQQAKIQLNEFQVI